MRTTGSIIMFALLCVSCQSTEKSAVKTPDPDIIHIPNLITSQVPDRADILNQSVYVDHVEIIIMNQLPAVLIQGYLPNPCYNLDTPKEIIQNGKIHLTIDAWQPLDEICVQVLHPFSYLHPLPEFVDTESFKQISINNTPYDL